MKARSILRWTTKGFNGLLFLGWGAFFLEHLSWFTTPAAGSPPAWVWLGQALHGLMLICLLLALKWERLGAAGTILFAALFFLAIIGIADGGIFFLITSAPSLVLLWLNKAHLLARRGGEIQPEATARR